MHHKWKHRAKNKKPVNMLSDWCEVYKQETGGEKLKVKVGADQRRPGNKASSLDGHTTTRALALGSDEDDT